MPQEPHRVDTGEGGPADDEAVLVAVQNHDSAALAQLYERYVRPVYRYLYSLVGNGPDAEDLTSMTFLRALEALPGYRRRGAFRAWLFAIARSRAMDHFRRRRPDPIQDSLPVQAETPDPASGVIDAQEKESLQRLFRALTVREQDLLRLRYAADLSYAEIGELVGKSEGSVKKSVYRLLARLQAQMGADDE